MEEKKTTYLDRMHEEEMQLKERIDKLTGFVTSNETFKTLSHKKQTLLLRQLDAMRVYEYILAERINLEENACDCCCKA